MGTFFIPFILMIVFGLISIVFGVVAFIQDSRADAFASLASLVLAFISGLFINAPSPVIYPLNNDVEKYTGTQVITIGVEDPFLKIYYSTGAEDPKDGSLYSEEFEINETTTISARTKLLWKWSDVVKSSYFFDEESTVDETNETNDETENYEKTVSTTEVTQESSLSEENNSSDINAPSDISETKQHTDNGLPDETKILVKDLHNSIIRNNEIRFYDENYKSITVFNTDAEGYIILKSDDYVMLGAKKNSKYYLGNAFKDKNGQLAYENIGYIILNSDSVQNINDNNANNSASNERAESNEKEAKQNSSEAIEKKNKISKGKYEDGLTTFLTLQYGIINKKIELTGLNLTKKSDITNQSDYWETETTVKMEDGVEHIYNIEIEDGKNYAIITNCFQKNADGTIEDLTPPWGGARRFTVW